MFFQDKLVKWYCKERLNMENRPVMFTLTDIYSPGSWWVGVLVFLGMYGPENLEGTISPNT